MRQHRALSQVLKVDAIEMPTVIVHGVFPLYLDIDRNVDSRSHWGFNDFLHSAIEHLD